MKAILLALLLISQSQKLQISGGLGFGGIDTGAVRNGGMTFYASMDYWVKNHLAFGIDSGIQTFPSSHEDSSTGNFFSIPHLKLRLADKKDEVMPFLLFGCGFDLVYVMHYEKSNYLPFYAFNFGAGLMKEYPGFIIGGIVNDIWIRQIEIDSEKGNIQFFTFSIFLGWGK